MTHNQGKNKPIKTDTEMTEIMELTDMNFKTSIINMFKDLNENMDKVG